MAAALEPTPIEQTLAGRRGDHVAALIGAWLVVVTPTLLLRPLSANEGLLLAGAGFAGASPLTGLLLRAVAAIGPPADLVLRALGLASALLGARAGARLLRDLGGRAAGSLAAPSIAGACLACHGAVLAAAGSLGPSALLWGAQAALLLLVLRAARLPTARAGTAAGAALAAAAAVATEPLAFTLVATLAGWLWRARRRGRAALALLLGGALALVPSIAWSPRLHLRAPDLALLARLARSLAGLGPEAGAAAYPVVAASMIAALAVAGLLRAGRDVAVICGGLLLSGALAAWLRPDAAAGVALVLPAVVLAASRLAPPRGGAGPDRLVWLALLLGVCGLTGLRAVTAAHRLPVDAAARALAPDERLVTEGRRGLERAVEFYRPRGPGPRRSKAARLWVPGDRQPRKVAVEAFGARVGELRLLRRGEPLYDLGEHLPGAEVVYTSNGASSRCSWMEAQGRFFCDGAEHRRVAWGFSTFDGVEADAVIAQPIDDGVLELRWRDVPLGGRLLGVAGVDDRSLEHSREPVRVEVRVADLPPFRFTRGAAPGLLPFEIDARRSAAPAGPVVVRVTTANDLWRPLFIDALVVPAGAGGGGP